MVIVMLYFGVAWSEREVNFPDLEVTDIFIFMFLAWPKGPTIKCTRCGILRLALCGHLLSDLGNEEWMEN